MLVLSRHANEKILIGDDITILVVEVKNGKTRLGISAPIGISIDREEVRESKRREGVRLARQRAAAGTSPTEPEGPEGKGDVK